MKKFLLAFTIGILVLLIIISVIVGWYLGPIVKIGMEQIGPRLTKTTINVDKVDISLITGSAALKGLLVGNPKGFKSPQLMSVGVVFVKLHPMSVLSQKIVIRSIRVQSPEITFEGGLSRNNINQVLANVNASAQATGGNQPKVNQQAAPQNGPTTAGNKPAPKLEVDDFLITGAKVHMVLPGLGTKTIPLPDIHLTNLGSQGNGITPVELTSAVLNALTEDIIKAVTRVLADFKLGNIGTTAVKTLGNITGSLGGLFSK